MGSVESFWELNILISSSLTKPTSKSGRMSAGSHEEAAATATQVELDPYRLHIHGEAEKHTAWRHGAPPSYEQVNKLFEEGRTKVCILNLLSLIVEFVRLIRFYRWSNHLDPYNYVQVWPKGSLEETVENLVKTWEMELSHKTNIQDFKTIDPQSFSMSVNGNISYISCQVTSIHIFLSPYFSEYAVSFNKYSYRRVCFV